jgi:hypothetical protein
MAAPIEGRSAPCLSSARVRLVALTYLWLGSPPACLPYKTCDDVDPAAVAQLPQRLSETGLYVEGGVDTVAPDVHPYRPRFELWSDGARKQRFVRLPEGARIDSSDMDSWQFPVGTQLWKEFTRDGTRVETRLIERRANGWVGLAYVWQADGADARAVPYGAIDALGSPHDVPASNECNACHGGRESFVLGFSALQLAEPDSAELNLQQLVVADLLSDAPSEPLEVPGNETEQAALGYLHANCSHCHNASRPDNPGARCFDPKGDLDFFLRATSGQTVAETSTYRTGEGPAFDKGTPGKSPMLELMKRRGRLQQMPPLATKVVDQAAVSLLERWIGGM